MIDRGTSAAILGHPPTANNLSAADTAALTTAYESLARRATITLPAGAYTPRPAAIDGVCDRSAVTNWGDGVDPSAPCRTYFPVVRVAGDLHIDDGVQGQGVLLVDGNLHVNGAFRYFGLVLVRGAIRFSGDATGAPSVAGMVISRKNGAHSLAADSLASSTTVTYSRCAVERGLRAARAPSVIRSRSWAQLF